MSVSDARFNRKFRVWVCMRLSGTGFQIRMQNPFPVSGLEGGGCFDVLNRVPTLGSGWRVAFGAPGAAFRSGLCVRVVDCGAEPGLRLRVPNVRARIRARIALQTRVPRSKLKIELGTWVLNSVTISGSEFGFELNLRFGFPN